MKIGSCLLLLATPKDPLAAASIPAVKRAGFDYAEVSLARVYDLSDQELDDYYSLFAANALPVEVFNNAIPRGLALVGPNSDPRALRDYAFRAVRLARRMGVSLITMSGPNQRTVPEGFSWDHGFEQYVSFLQMYADCAAQEGISLAVEPINQEEHGFIATVSEACRAVHAAGCPNVKTIVDFYHFFKQNDDWENLLKVCSDELVHAHYAVQEGRVYPRKENLKECERVLTPFLNAGYHGRISVEAYAPHPEEDLPDAVQVLRSICGAHT